METTAARWSAQEAAILRTVLYASLFEYPITVAELRRSLLGVVQSESGLLRTYCGSARLRARIDYREGLFFPRGRTGWIAQRYARENRSLAFLRGHTWLLRVIAAMPFVRLVALSGSVAALNADARADLDLFVVTKGPRVWLVTLAVVLLAKLVRYRRMVCLNFVLSDERLHLEQQDLFAANQAIHLRPLSGRGVYEAFLAANPFVRRFYPNFDPRVVQSPIAAEPGAAARRAKRALEWLLGPIAGVGDRLSRTAYGWHLRRRAASWRSPADVRLQATCLKLHTRSHRQPVLERFEAVCRQAFRAPLHAPESHDVGTPPAPADAARRPQKELAIP